MPTNPVPVLSDDEVDQLLTPHRFDGFLVLKPDERDALCATVRALREENSTLKKHWADTSEDLASAWLKNDELKSTNTALREQLAQAEKAIVKTRTCERCAPLVAQALKEKP